MPKQVLSKGGFFDTLDKEDFGIKLFTQFQSSTNNKSKVFFFATDAVAKFILPKAKKS